MSVGLYVASRLLPMWLDNPLGASWQFNPLAWQLLFVIGVTLGVSARQAQSGAQAGAQSGAQAGAQSGARGSRVLLAAASAYALYAFWIGAAAWDFDGAVFDLPPAMHALLFPIMDRANLSLWRLADVLALAYVVAWFVGPKSPVLRWRVSRALILCGQHSLPLFCVGVV
ncbi:MAG: OpgC domain-containing protein, partial [Vicinamibacterales bacterium]